ncbi:hypothetical protein Lalb_Chr03g0024681 [Lupinus albus]|uniref:Uncharacterized protein n=1 Tax=Lupinus albus TaxID=3870 RepID=A0A6A4QPQ6_LUPAL|nr:hypothetical protein Lalb_Chr03g0024681 [Lupinus albus]
MGWFYPKKMKQHVLTGQSMKTFSLSPTFHLLIIFGIVITLLWFSLYTDYKTHSHQIAIKFHFLLFFSLVLFILFFISYSSIRTLFFHFPISKHHSLQPDFMSSM